MVLWATILILQGASLVGSTTGIPGVPENITVMFLNPTSVRVSWSTSQVEQVEKYDVTYKPTDARVVAVVAGNSEAVTLSNLRADTQYQLVVTAVKGGKKLRSRPIVFRTLEPPRTSPQQDSAVTGNPIPPPPPSSAQQPQTYIQIRGVEVGIVVMVLLVWVGAIALFFNRWGKIRMLLPYQPDYKEQLKVPGTGVGTSTSAGYPHSTSQHACSQHLHWSSHHVDSVDSAAGAAGINWPKTSRPRVNSAIDVAGFLSQEFLRRHGSTSRLCRKVRSADNLPLATSNRLSSEPRDDTGSQEDERADREHFLKSSQREDSEEKSDETETRQSSLDKAQNETALLDSGLPHHHESSRELCPEQSASTTACVMIAGPTTSTAQSSSAARRFAGWRAAGLSNREYVRCPVRQPASVEERCYRRSCELAEQLPRCSLPGASRPPPLVHHHHRRHDGIERHARSCEYARPRSSFEQQQQHFGLPILSVSEPSPPDEVERADDYL